MHATATVLVGYQLRMPSILQTEDALPRHWEQRPCHNGRAVRLPLQSGPADIAQGKFFTETAAAPCTLNNGICNVLQAVCGLG